MSDNIAKPSSTGPRIDGSRCAIIQYISELFGITTLTGIVSCQSGCSETTTAVIPLILIIQKAVKTNATISSP